MPKKNSQFFYIHSILFSSHVFCFISHVGFLGKVLAKVNVIIWTGISGLKERGSVVSGRIEVEDSLAIGES